MTPKEIKSNNEVGKAWIDAGGPDDMLEWLVEGFWHPTILWNNQHLHRIRQGWKPEPKSKEDLQEQKATLEKELREIEQQLNAVSKEEIIQILEYSWCVENYIFHSCIYRFNSDKSYTRMKLRDLPQHIQEEIILIYLKHDTERLAQ